MEAYATPASNGPEKSSYDNMKTMAPSPVSPQQEFLNNVLRALDEFEEPVAADLVAEIRSGFVKRLDGRIRNNNEQRNNIDERNSMLESIIKRTVSPL